MKKKIKNNYSSKIFELYKHINIDHDRKMSLMWYFVSWHNKIHKWPVDRKRRYALQISKLAESVPLHLIDSSNAADKINFVIKDKKLNLLGYDKGKFVIFSEKGKVLQEVSATNLYAMLVYLVDSLTGGLDTYEGFEFVKMAKELIKRDSK